jgi:TolA-binding protein
MRMIPGKYVFISILFAFAFLFGLNAQKSTFDSRSDASYLKATALFENEKYAIAQKFFLEIVHNPSFDNTILRSNSEYYALICAIELQNEDAEVLGTRFIARNPESIHINEAIFRLGKFEYGKKRYRLAIGYFKKVNKEELNEDDQAEYYFKMGYCYFMTDSIDKARKAFFEIKDIDSRYTSPAIYYYSHIAYNQKNYETAIEGFNKLKGDETFAPLVPYYITQSYYYQEKYDDLLTYAPNLIDSVIPTRLAEMARMIADAYYHKNQFKEAIPFYEKYFEKGKEFKPADYFQAGYCQYVEAKYNKASELFEKSAFGNTDIAQNSTYLLGDCYIKLKKKDRALMAFGAASKMNFDPRIKEDASFNYAVLTYEMSNSPFNSSIKALNDYITKFPDSRRNDEACHFLVTACLNTHNYQDAISYLDKLKNKDKNAKKAYQRAAFFRGLELFNNLQFDGALKLFETSLKYSDSDPVITARTHYWSAEAYYRLKDINSAIDNYNLFLSTDVSKKCQEYTMAFYNLGYCNFHNKEYSQASDWFLKFLDNSKDKKDKFVADALNRLGDCKFADSKYTDAIGFYTKAIESGLSDKDYAIYQKAFTLGLQNDHKKKISLLNQLITSMPESNYNDDALFEIGRSEISLQKNDDAKKYFNKLIKDYPSSSFVKKALLQLGLIDYNSGDNIAALEKYKKVVSDFPGTQESKDALGGIKNIYVELNEVDNYIKYTESLGNIANVSATEQDSLMYYAGENAYLAGDCKKAKDNFKKYVEKFPEGDFILNATYYIGDCSFKDGDDDNALKSFEYVIKKQKNNFTEPALATAALLNMNKKNYPVALSEFKLLDSIAEVQENIMAARSGQMRIQYLQNNFEACAVSASKLLTSSGLTQENERLGHFYLGKSYLALNQQDKALEQFGKLAGDVKNTEGAEAKYRIAEIYMKLGKQDKAQKEIFNFVELNTPHQYWIARAYIMLAEIYHNKKDDFQATSTLKSIIDNYDNKDDGIIKEATLKKEQIESKIKLDNAEKDIENEEPDLYPK